MERLGELKFLEGLSHKERLEHVFGGQSAWYLLCSQLFRGMSIIDCGAGDGSGSAILRGQGDCLVTAIDPNPAGPGVTMHRLQDLKRHDAVLLIDVLEHVFHPEDLLQQACDRANYVFLSTPNWNFSHCANPFHVFEFKPRELDAMLAVGPTKEYCIHRFGGTTLKCVVEMPCYHDSHFPAQFGVLIHRRGIACPTGPNPRPGHHSRLSEIASLFDCPSCESRLSPCILGSGLVCRRCGMSYVPQTDNLSSQDAVRAWLPQLQHGPPEPPWLHYSP